MAMPTYVGQINTIVVSGSISRAWPTGHTTDDIAFFVGQTGTGGYPSTARPQDLTGWTEIPLTNNATSGTTGFVDKGIALWWYRLPGPSQPNLLITNSSATNPWCSVVVIRGLDNVTSTPYNQVVCNFTDSSTTSVTYPTLTTTKNDCLIINFGFAATNNTTAQHSAFSSPSLTSVTNRINTGSASGHQTYINTGEMITAGSISAATATMATANKYVNLIISAGEYQPVAVTEKYLFGTSGTTYLLTGTKLLDLKRGRAYRVKNMTNLIIILDDGRVFRKIQDNVLVDN